MRLIALLAACSGPPPGSEPGDSGPGGHTGSPVDSADTGDTGSTVDSTDSADTGDSVPGIDCADPVVVFRSAEGVDTPLTDALLQGTYTTLDAPGTLYACPRTWFARLLVRAPVQVVGLGAEPGDTVLCGGESGTILDVLGPDGTLEVVNLTLDRGAGLDVDHNSGGGGIYCEGYGSVTTDEVVFSNNFANDGAGLYVEDCEVSLARTRFVDNTSEDDGGAFTLWYSHATLDEVSFEGNVGLDGGAAALFYATAELRDVSFADNRATHFAGALWAYETTLAASGGSFTGNQNTGAEGGGLLVDGAATLDGVRFADNTASRGGGLYVYYQAVVAGSGLSFEGNTPDDIFGADYSEAGGVSYQGGSTVNCADNVCVVE